MLHDASLHPVNFFPQFHLEAATSNGFSNGELIRPLLKSICTGGHGWASAELLRNRANINLFLRHIRDLSSQKSQTKVGTLTCFSFLYQNELTM